MSRGPQTESIALQLNPQTQPITFQLCRRTLDFGLTEPVDYFWMNSSQFRTGSGGSNLKACIDWWWGLVESHDDAHDIYAQVNLVFAESYSLVNTSRAMQSVFRDAYLHHAADRMVEFENDHVRGRRRRNEFTRQLAQVTIDRLQSVVQEKSVLSVQQELETVLCANLPTGRERQRLTEAAQHWAGNGCIEFRRGGREGLRTFIQSDLQSHIRSFRNRGGNEEARRFLNVFSYEAKVTFYRCLANTWSYLIDELDRRFSLSPASIRFMRFWHNQKQPELLPDGTIINMFHGQVLSVHPLSAIVETSPEHLIRLGRWFGHPDYDALMQRDAVAQCEEYWDVVLTILVAAHQYRESQEHWESGRRNQRAAPQVESETVTDDERQTALEEFAENRQIRCRRCRGVLGSVVSTASEQNQGICRVTYRCNECQSQQEVEIAFDDFRQHRSDFAEEGQLDLNGGGDSPIH